MKNIAISLVLLTMVIVIIAAVDTASNVGVSVSETYLRVTVVDLNDKPVHNAKITVNGNSFFTDNKGLSPAIQIAELTNSYNSDITEWHTVNVTVQKDGYVPSVVFNCVLYDSQTRKLTVKLYEKDASALPYVCYVESPPGSFVNELLQK